MQPTNELRFVDRELNDGIGKTCTVKVLQQKWMRLWSEDMGGGERESEWRDVPCVKEEI